LTNGWRYGTPRCDEKRIHDCLKPYSELSDDVQKRDRETVEKYWDILDEGGYKIVTNVPWDRHRP
jgi:hypothetical protein